ncbi:MULTISPECIES: tyrosine-type recombinase/integrase [Rhizobium]|uniref:Tyr recombinase domain-containing protein n=1 Tax=Rhizobium leguminosarum bv. viciae TaxID=387 RepID=A0A8G2IUM8_RHILV|nr:tyrosine-type recombinase/integrase [Rhizobium leguminosarum]NKK11425.1 tyrosine-type recombinase/integrase [Rhizobium leguminosarum bv. viciae]NKK25384.1 tyrosine-type recombinase/integrase [Rhizobium leguminosarum bv. viciae]TBX89050.1 hypothetical protein E0H31_25585 [Rhizobium leguminosarum bv. viciae]TBZ13984.1 hypothetical protein E0H52_25235 [Rhizobium leguminosarum bv. viciae]
MAQLLTPKKALRKGIHAIGQPFPYIVTNVDTLADGVNHFIVQRGRGRVSTSLKEQLRTKPLDTKTVAQISHRLVDHVTWLESEIAHPISGRLSWYDMRRWLIEELFEPALAKGYWSREFWTTGRPTPLAYRSTVVPRVEEAIRCGIWMERNGYIEGFSSAPDDTAIAQEIAAALQSFELIERQFGSASSSLLWPKQQVRQDPGALVPPSDTEIGHVLAALPSGTMPLIGLSLYELGLRASELVKHMKIPPSWFGPSDRSIVGGTTLGYLPDLNVVLSNDPNIGVKCKWRVQGKFGKIRFVMIPPKLLRLVWKYFRTTRKAILEGKPSRFHEAHELFLNARGRPVSFDNISLAFRRANNDLGRDERVTPHLLRHAYACKFLEVGLLADLKNHGIDLSTATYEQMMHSGEGVLIALQANLGHEDREVTMRYLQQYAGREMAFRYQTSFNTAIDQFTELSDAA